MSYAIEYARQFIRSQEGITPCWLVGDNNVTEGRGRYERRVRNWSCFCNFLGATEDEILARVQPWLGEYQQHWKRNGKWVSDKGLLNWIKSGIKSAASVEDILKRNPACCGAIRCSAHVWRGFNHTTELEYYIHTTSEFDEWIRRYRALKDQLSREKVEIYPKVDFGTEYIRHPVSASDDDRFYLRKNKRYLTKLTDNEVCWRGDVNFALTFSYNEATNLLRENCFLANASLVKVPKEQGPRAIIQITEGHGAGSYVYELTSWRLRISNKEAARQYSSHKTARAALKRILERYPQVTNAEVVQI